MSLSIYTIKHPLALSWASCLLQEEISTFEEFDLIQKIILVLVYESTRKFIPYKDIFLKKLNYLDEINIVTSNFAYCIIANSYISQIVGKNILSMLPQSVLYNLPINTTMIKEICNKYNVQTSNIRILLIQEELNNKVITDILNILPELDIQLQNLQVCSIRCSNKTLEMINLTCPHLNIYTIKLINN